MPEKGKRGETDPEVTKSLARRREVDEDNEIPRHSGKPDSGNGRLEQQSVSVQTLGAEAEKVGDVEEKEAADERQQQEIIRHSKPRISLQI